MEAIGCLQLRPEPMGGLVGGWGDEGNADVFHVRPDGKAEEQHLDEGHQQEHAQGAPVAQDVVRFLPDQAEEGVHSAVEDLQIRSKREASPDC